MKKDDEAEMSTGQEVSKTVIQLRETFKPLAAKLTPDDEPAEVYSPIHLSASSMA